MEKREGAGQGESCRDLGPLACGFERCFPGERRLLRTVTFVMEKRVSGGGEAIPERLELAALITVRGEEVSKG